MSIYEEVTRAAVTVLIPVFNNLVLFDQHKERNTLDPARQIPVGLEVAPRAGAWIETGQEIDDLGLLGMSPLARGRGLKLGTCDAVPLFPPVAPRAGAWIETSERHSPRYQKSRRPSRGGVD